MLRALFGVFVCTAFVPSLAAAHLALTDPPSREGGEVLKTGPCGRAGSTRGTNVTTYEAGQTIEIVIDEYIDHPSHYRVAFDVDGDDDFAEPVCVENCTTNGATPPVFAADTTGTVLLDFIEDAGTREQRFTVTLPDVVCARCTLQVIQVMYDKRPYTIGGNDNYYQCADVVLVARPSDDAGVSTDAGSEPIDAGASDAGARDAGRLEAALAPDSGPHDHGTVESGCSCRTTGEARGAWVALLLILPALRGTTRRRTRRDLPRRRGRADTRR
jgi:MYXO-CTERM domain-containing protein